MKLKIFFFPLALVAAVVMSIWYIWPAYQESVAHKETLSNKQKQLGILEERKTLVDGLSVQLNRNPAVKNFLFRYIPLAPDEEYLVNAIDNAAKLAGINLVLVDVLRGNHQTFFGAENDQNTAQDALAPTEDMMVIAPEIKRPEMKELAVDVVVVGTYDGLKKFFSEVHKIDRMHGVMSASLERINEEDKTANDLLNVDTASDGDGTLLGQMVASFVYMENVRIPRGADGALFEQGINVAKVQEMQALHVSAPTLTLDNTGRTNPFAPADEVVETVEVVDVAVPATDVIVE